MLLPAPRDLGFQPRCSGSAGFRIFKTAKGQSKKLTKSHQEFARTHQARRPFSTLTDQTSVWISEDMMPFEKTLLTNEMRATSVEKPTQAAAFITDLPLSPHKMYVHKESAPVLSSYLTPVEIEVHVGDVRSPRQHYAVGDFRLVRPGTEIRRIPSRPATIRAVLWPLQAFQDYVDEPQGSAQEILRKLERKTFRSNSLEVLLNSLANAQIERAPGFFIESLGHAILLEVCRLTWGGQAVSYKTGRGRLRNHTLGLVYQFVHDSM